MKIHAIISLAFFSFSFIFFGKNPQDSPNLDNFNNKLIQYSQKAPGEISESLSPDGKWFFTSKAIFYPSDDFHVFSMLDNNELTLENSTSLKGVAFSFVSWSPQSNAFLIRAYDVGGICGDTRVYIFKISGNIITPTVFEDGYMGCSRLYWAPSGKEFLIYPEGNDDKVIIDDFSNSKTKVIPIELHRTENIRELISEIYWTDNGFFYQVINIDPKDVRADEFSLYEFSLEKPGSRLLKFASDKKFYLLGVTQKEIILSTELSEASESRVVIINRENNTEIENYLIPGSIYFCSMDPTSNFIALGNREKEGGKINLEIINIHTKQIQKNGHIDKLVDWFGWRDVVDGFLYLDTLDSKPVVKVLKMDDIKR